MMAKPAKKSFKANTLIILFLPFHDEGEAGMLQMMSTLLRFCNQEQMSRSLPEVQIFLSIHQELKVQILSASFKSFISAGL